MTDMANKRELDAVFAPIAGKFAGIQCIVHRTTDESLRLRCESVAEIKSQAMSQSAGYEYTVGVLRGEWMNPWFKAASGSVLSMAQEFGTLSNIKVARALQFENAGYHYDRGNHAFWHTYTRDAFYVQTQAWKLQVLSRGIDAVSKLLPLVTVRTRQEVPSM